MTAQRISDLGVRDRRRAILRTLGAIAACWVIIVLLYYLLPVDASHGAALVLRILIILAVLVGVLVWQVMGIQRAPYPELRAAWAGGVLVPFFLVMFATTYLSMSYAGAATFSESLDHTRALYFTITVFSTVGFGDITPRTDPARAVVMAQMIMDLIVIGFAFRILFIAARNRVSVGTDAGAS